MTRRGVRPVLVAGCALAAVVLVGRGLVVGSAAALNLGASALTVERTCTLSATPTTTTTVVDASVRQSNATTNYGTQTTDNVASGSAANRRLYVRFDLTACSPAIPATSTIESAFLRLYASALPTTCRTVDIFRATAAWAEGTLTWNNQPFGTAINNPASATATDTFQAGTPAGCANRTTGTYLTGASVTTDVAAFVAGSATNNGWMLRDDVEGAATTVTITVSGKELGTVAQVPQLVVVYAPP